MITEAMCMTWQLRAVIPEPPLPVKREGEGENVARSLAMLAKLWPNSASTTIIPYEFFQANNQWGYATGSTWTRA